MNLGVNIVCRNWRDDRVLPRFARYLADGLGWELTARPSPTARVHYLMGYFESALFDPWPPERRKVASLFTHREEEPPRNKKARLYDAVAETVGLRVAMCRLYAERLALRGPTITPPLPVERDRFVIADRPKRPRPLVGFAGYTYGNHRKGEDLVPRLIHSGLKVAWAATGRGWPLPCHDEPWKRLPAYFQSLDVFVCPSRVEGGPLTVLEALACGTPVVVPRGVGIIDELPPVLGIHSYRRGDLDELATAIRAAAFPAVAPDREALRAATEPYTVEAWCRAHAAGFARWLEVAA